MNQYSAKINAIIYLNVFEVLLNAYKVLLNLFEVLLNSSEKLFESIGIANKSQVMVTVCIAAESSNEKLKWTQH